MMSLRRTSENYQASTLAYAIELRRRRQARRGLLDFTRYTMPNFQYNWHHKTVADFLDRWVFDDSLQFAMVFLPPRHTKSEFVSRKMPPFILGQNPDYQVANVSYGDDLAKEYNLSAQQVMSEKPYNRLFPYTQIASTVSGGETVGKRRTANHVDVLGHRGYYKTTSVSGRMVGFGYDFGIVDDPIKDRNEADSETHRKRLKNWFNGVWLDRMNSQNAKVLMTVTRWSDLDICGYLLDLADREDDALQWEVLKMPVIAEEPIEHYDKRQVGEALWADRFDKKALKKKKATIGLYEWNSKWQQRPAPLEGAKFKRAWFENFVDKIPKNCLLIRYWDKAGTEGGGAYSAGVLVAIDQDTGLTYIVNSIRGQWSALERERVIKQTAELDYSRYGYKVTNYIEQEGGSGGKESAESTVRNLRGFAIKTDRPTGNKDLRLVPFQAQAEGGNVCIVRGAWNEEWIEEMVAIPNGKYRDQGDATSGAFNNLTNVQPTEAEEETELEQFWYGE